MGEVKARFAEPEDAEKVAEWIQDHLQYPDSIVDPRSRVICVENGSPLIFTISYGAVVIEGFGIKPGITPREWVEGMNRTLEAITAMAQFSGAKDLVFFAGTGAEQIEKAAARRGFELTNLRVWRKKL